MAVIPDTTHVCRTIAGTVSGDLPDLIRLMKETQGPAAMQFVRGVKAGNLWEVPLLTPEGEPS